MKLTGYTEMSGTVVISKLADQFFKLNDENHPKNEITLSKNNLLQKEEKMESQ